MLLIIVVMTFVILPCLTLIHELGHAAAALLLTRNEITVFLGTAPTINADSRFRFSWQWGRLRFVTQPFRGFFGFCRHGKSDARWKSMVISGAGPLASLTTAALIWFLDTTLEPDLGVFDYAPQWAGMFAFISFLVTALPMRYPSWWGAYKGMDSDGMRIYRVLTTTAPPPPG